jgi:POT family proton-dependent oligopeptide transporter
LTSVNEAAPASAPRRRHPKGLPFLFFTELWERFSFYTMGSLLALYMNERLRFSPGLAGQVQGLYGGLVYLLPLFGGLLADRRLGFHRAVIIGAVLMMFGHLTLAIESLPFFFTALVLLVLGSGLLKPNVSTILGELYRDRPDMRDAGFNIFYMGINIGAIAGPLSAAYLRTHYSWRLAFASAGGGMVISLAIFVSGLKSTQFVRSEQKDQPETAPAVPPGEARERVVALLVIFAIISLFWAAFYQYWYTVTFWARDNLRITMPPETTQAIEPICVVAFTPVLVWLWAVLRARKKEPRTPLKMLLGLLSTVAAFGILALAGRSGGDTGRVSVSWIVGFYFWLAMAELLISPMGLSLVSRVAPPGKRGVMMGAWFAFLGLGAYASGPLGTLWYKMPHSAFFGLITVIQLVAGVLLLFFVRRLNRVIDKTV